MGLIIFKMNITFIWALNMCYHLSLVYHLVLYLDVCSHYVTNIKNYYVVPQMHYAFQSMLVI